MNGLGEVCSHIAAVLFYVEATLFHIKEREISTQMKCERILPSYFKNLEYLSICNTSTKTKKKKIDCKIDDSEGAKTFYGKMEPKCTSERWPGYDEMIVFE